MSKLDDILDDYVVGAGELELASFTKAQYLEEISLLTKEVKKDLIDIIAGVAVSLAEPMDNLIELNELLAKLEAL